MDSKNQCESIFLLEYKPKIYRLFIFIFVRSFVRIYALEKLTNKLKSERISIHVCVVEKIERERKRKKKNEYTFV